MSNVARKSATTHADTYGWQYQNTHGAIVPSLYEKNGLQLYFVDGGGFELSYKDPDTFERVAAFECSDIDTSSPLYAALLEHAFANAENIVHYYQTNDED
jgi:hypothetical protein